MEPIQPLEPMSLSAMDRLRNNNIIQAWLVLTLAICFGAALAGIYLALGPKIEANKLNETLEKVPELVLGAEQVQIMTEQNNALNIEPRSIRVEKNGRKVFYSVYEARYADGKSAGWVVKTKGQGYADKIELLLGLDPLAENITGVFILDQKETPGLGNKIVTDEWRSQFIKKKTHKFLEVVKEDAVAANEIDAITGATISSRSVTSIINTAVNDLKGPLTAKAPNGS